MENKLNLKFELDRMLYELIDNVQKNEDICNNKIFSLKILPSLIILFMDKISAFGE